jgi:hypothetical protein
LRLDTKYGGKGLATDADTRRCSLVSKMLMSFT